MSHASVEQFAAHPILAPLLPYLRHARPDCSPTCGCGLDSIVDQLEASIHGDIEVARRWAVRLEQRLALARAQVAAGCPEI